MAAAAAEAKWVAPGERLGRSSEYKAGAGTYVHGDHVVASVVGVVATEAVGGGDSDAAAGIGAGAGAGEGPAPAQPTLSVSITGEADARVPVPGDVVTARITRITTMQASADIVCVGDDVLRQPMPALIRKEHVREVDVDSVVMQDSFRPGDIVRAEVASLGDARSYMLLTARVDLGVVYAVHSSTGESMTAVSWKEMQCPVTKDKELRKVARVDF